MSVESEETKGLNFKYVSLKTVIQAQIGMTRSGIVGAGGSPQMVVFEGPAPQEQVQGFIDNLKAMGYLLFHAAEEYLLFAKEDGNESQNGQRNYPRIGVEAGPGDRPADVPGPSGTGVGVGESKETGSGQQDNPPTRPTLTLLEGGAGKQGRPSEDEGQQTS